jgi:hypothetical protein
MSWTSARITALAGAALTVVATCLPWFRFDLLVGNSTEAGSVGIGQDLWTISTLAAIIIVVAAVLAGIAMLAPDIALRGAGLLALIAGTGIAVYAVIRWFDMPDGLAVATGAVGTASALSAAPFLAFAGGAAIALSGARVASSQAVRPARAPQPHPA